MTTSPHATITAANAAITAAAADAVAGNSACAPGGDTPVGDLAPTLRRLRDAWQAHKPAYAQRHDDLRRLREALKRRLPEMANTIAADFGHRSRHESLIADGMTVLNEIDHLASHLRRWMKPRTKA